MTTANPPSEQTRRTPARISRFVRFPLATLTGFALVGAVLITVQIWRNMEDLRRSSATEAATSYSNAISEFRAFYSREIVPRARAAGAAVTHDYRGRANAIPLPATMSIDLAEDFRTQLEDVDYNLYSDLPFPSRKERRLDSFERAALEAIRRDPTAPFIKFEEYNGKPSIRYAVPVFMAESCVKCHNAHEDSPRRDWRAGDIRGIQQVTLSIDSTARLSFAKVAESAAFIAIFVVLALLLTGFLIGRLRRSLHLSQKMTHVAERRNVKLLEAKLEADRANKAKSAFLANMSHELRTPLNAIIGFTELMRDERFGPLGSENYKAYSQEVVGSGKHLLDIINDILQMSQIDSGKLVLEDADVDIRHVIAACIRLARGQAESADLAVKSKIARDLPALLADELAVKKIVHNILSNAVKFTLEGSITISAWLDGENRIVLRIADTGVGMDVRELPRLMEPFSQADESFQREFQGTGLGLPIAKSLMDVLGGDIDVESEIGAGTTVTLRFPAARTRATTTPQHAEKNLSTAAE